MYADFSSVFQTHPAAKDRHLEIITGFSPHQTIKTDRILLMRILLNLLINAFEASAPGDTVRLSQTCTKTDIVFQVHNSGVIPAHLRARIFQRNFSTKAKLGRGLGTWSIKLFAEQYLNGRVWFETSNTGGLPSAHQGEGLSSAHQGGTTFFLSLPL